MGKLLLPLLAAFLSLGALLTGAQAAQTPLYIALGDSLSEGVGASVRGESDFVSRVRDSLPGEFELLNMGESGDTSGDLIGHRHLDHIFSQGVGDHLEILE